MNSNFRAFWLAPVFQNILVYSLFCDRNQDAVETFSEDEICVINEAVVQKNTKKATNFGFRCSLFGRNYFHPEFATKS